MSKSKLLKAELTSIEVIGNSNLSDNYIKNRLKKSINTIPLKLEILEDELRLLQQNPQVKRIKAEIRPDLELGQNRLLLTVEDISYYYYISFYR